MYYRQRTLGRLAQAQQPAAQNYTIPASVGGVNALDPLISLPPQDCFYTFNLMPSEYGLRLRKGYREWATGVGTTQTDVRAIIPFEGRDPDNRKLFAATADGIYDVTTDGETTPDRDVTFSTTTGNAGFCTWTEMTLDNGDQKLFVADPENGLHMYDEDTDTWSVPSLTGLAAADVAFVILHKQRLWVIPAAAGDAYYGPVDSISGTFTKFTFGSKFKYGGELLTLANWTLDGGDGVDDYLVGISRGGDVLAYRGSDPSATDWTLTGSFYVGQMPNSRRCTQPYAGELFILSTFGITSLRDLVQGVAASDTGRSVSAKINRILRSVVQDSKEDPEWMISTNPSDGFLQIVAPFASNGDQIQYSQNLLTKAWGYWSNVPMLCSDSWEGGYYFGASDGRVFVYSGNTDNVTIAGADGEAIQFSILTSFQAVGDHATWKQAGMVRVVGVTGPTVAYNMKIVYDYNVLAEANAPAGSGTVISPSIWDTAVWDSGVWNAGDNGAQKTEGGNGIGRTIALAMRGESQSRITIVGWDMTVTGGGFL